MESENKNIIGAILTIVAVIVTIFLFILAKRIPLVINLFRESVKAIFAMPLIILEPMLVQLCNLCLFIGLIKFVLYFRLLYHYLLHYFYFY